MASASSSPDRVDLRRWLRICLRSGHILTTSVLVGGHVFGASPGELRPWLYGVVITGLLMWTTDWGQGWSYFRELRSVAVAVKILLLAAVPIFWEQRVAILMAVVLLSGIVSHMPGRYRYWSLGRGPRGEDAQRAGLG